MREGKIKKHRRIGRGRCGLLDKALVSFVPRLAYNVFCIYAGGDYCTEPKTVSSKVNRNSRLCNRAPRPPLADMQCYMMAFPAFQNPPVVAVCI